MSEIVRVSLSIEKSLFDRLEEIVVASEYGNRSEFIRAAILAALDSVCPVCSGTGVLSPRQRHHWEAFSRTHALETCTECHEARLVCNAARG